jgi:hypothetical protein
MEIGIEMEVETPDEITNERDFTSLPNTLRAQAPHLAWQPVSDGTRVLQAIGSTRAQLSQFRHPELPHL